MLGGRVENWKNGRMLGNCDLPESEGPGRVLFAAKAVLIPLFLADLTCTKYR